MDKSTAFYASLSIHGLHSIQLRLAASHLQDAHPVGVSQDLLGLLIVAIPNLGGGYEQLEWIVFLRVE